MEQKTSYRKRKILIAEDDLANRKLLVRFIEELGFVPIPVEDGCEILTLVNESHPDLILLDLGLPCQNGLSVLKDLKATHTVSEIPVLMITGSLNRDERLEAIDMGVSDFLRKPLDFEELRLRLRNNLELKEYRDIIEARNQKLEERVQEGILDLQEKNEELMGAIRATEAGYRETIFRLNLAAEYRDEHTGDHVQRIGFFAAEMAGLLGMDNEFCRTIFESATMHDVGKVGIPDSILMKPGKLTPDERRIMETHTLIGSEILKGSRSPFLIMGEEIARTHHEQWNGRGYPRGLRGEEIPLSGRIVHLVDQYDALRSQRPYKKPMSHEVAIRIILKGDDRTSPDSFDPELLSLFEKYQNLFFDLYQEHSGAESTAS